MPARPPAMRLRAALGRDWIVASAELSFCLLSVMRDLQFYHALLSLRLSSSLGLCSINTIIFFSHRSYDESRA
eukprot:scaffold416_cov115-Skeletonema_marinoi.AAC.2